MVSELVPSTYGDVVFIARRLRALDAEEIFPLTWSGKPEDLAALTIAAGGISTVALSGGAPVAAYGAYLSRPLCWTVWMFATDRWSEVALPVTRDIRRRMMPLMLEGGAVRADCWSMDGHDVAHRWLEVLGAVREASIEDHGPTRKTFHCYSWTRSRLERDGDFDHVRRTIRAENAKSTHAAAAAGATPRKRRSRSKRGGGGKAKTHFGSKGPSIDNFVR